VTSDPDFKVTTLFDIEYFRNDTRYSHSYYRTSIESRIRSIEWWHFQWPWRTVNPVFKVTVLLKSITIDTNRKSYAIYRILPLSMTLSDLWPGFQGHYILKSNIGKTDKVLKTQLLFHANRKPSFQGHTAFLKSNISRDKVSIGH